MSLLDKYPSGYAGINISVTFSKEDYEDILIAKQLFETINKAWTLNSGSIFVHIIKLYIDKYHRQLYLATQTIQTELDRYFHKQVLIKLCELSEENYKYSYCEKRLAIVGKQTKTIILYGDFQHYPQINLYCGDEVDDICTCHYTDSTTYLPFIQKYYERI